MTKKHLFSALITGFVSTACSPLKHAVVDAAMLSAYRAPALRVVTGDAAAPALELLAGDFHCHVSPPDGASHVGRGLEDTVKLARREQLDFVVLTPHVRARFFQNPAAREELLAEQRTLREDLRNSDRGSVQFFVGFEYTDWGFGHVGTAFGDLEQTLEGLSIDTAHAEPEKFFERWIASGGILIINHPLLQPVDTFIPIQTWDLSWRPLHEEGPFPPEIEAAHRLAQGYEAYNLQMAHLRDRYLLGEEERTLIDTIAAYDREIVRQERRITPVGGSDSHSHHLRASTFVLSRGRTAAAIREAVVAGRTCVRSPEACSLLARDARGNVAGIGGTLDGVTRVEAWVAAEPRSEKHEGIELIAGAERRSGLRAKEVVTIEVPAGKCTLLRARVGAGFSAPIYLNCPFAS